MAAVSRLSRQVSYFVCGTPRTGSTLLCGLLRATGVAGRPESYFRLPDEADWAARWGVERRSDGSLRYADFARAAVAAGTTANGAFGARVMWGTLDHMLAGLRAGRPEVAGTDLDLLTEAFGPLRFVHLHRADVVAQAVSWARAEQTGYWQEGDVAAAEPAFDIVQIRSLVATIEEHNAAWRSWFASVGARPFELRYEDVVADPAGALRGVLTFLGLDWPGGHRVEAGTRRQADEVSADWIARYHAAGGR
jgi:LPS sulfotransferase NodH